MTDLKNKVLTNIKNGSLFSNGYIAIKNRIIKYVANHNIFYIFDKDRVRTKNYLNSIPLIDHNHIEAGNYFLDKRIEKGPHSIVYSLGILNDIRFDNYISRVYNCKVFMYDPTPVSIEFMKSQKNSNFYFFPFGVWTEQTVLTFYEPKYGGSSSLIDNSSGNDGKTFNAECYTINQLMQKNGHNHIDVFKADIEGAALPIIEQMIEQRIFPTEIVVEFERPRKDQSLIDDFFKRVDEVRKKLKYENYREFQIPRGHAKYYSIEFLFVKF
ncbi:FkbM family methyltransferase [Acidiluteibacter ferrifornacis]|uniref:FkbM family methyltransferase n=1 Tax=Acidiluteibacter ferrifornacis TaxID=2692424 RepID=A0A6N9NGU8_9FLAO|nr:FkbM family methyltransferase [Acidiluteibacter ferrifornacis]NBG65878.1 FkbM family methyltransferase [Acidiluteibacter ferrifornacis]